MTQSNLILTAVDATAIQPYIFGSNLLRENVGASELVRLATGRWALEKINEVTNGNHNIDDFDSFRRKEGFRIEETNDETAAEVIYAGTGNALIIFRSSVVARWFTKELTLKSMVEAPGLRIVVDHTEFDGSQSGGLQNAVDRLLSKIIPTRKDSFLPSAPLLGLGVTAACEATGLVAVQTDEDLKPRKEERTRLISSETRAKLEANENANLRLRKEFKSELTYLKLRLEREYGQKISRELVFARDIDNLARVLGEESYVAVVHADGNRMGEHLKGIGSVDKTFRSYADDLYKFSLQVKNAAATALKKSVTMLFDAISFDNKSKNFLMAAEIPLQEDERHIFLPFRPLVFGGDDVTFICNAQVGMSMAAEYLAAFEVEVKKQTNRDIYSRAGVAMVKMHYPFSRAYSLSSELSSHAKEVLRPHDACALDWHFATSGLSGSLNEIREREYQDGRLLMRPLLLSPEPDDQTGRAWFGRIEKLVRDFQGKLGEAEQDPTRVKWEGKRNKVKALREALRGGSEEVQRMLEAYEIARLPKVLPTSDDHQNSGWNGDRCVYFDAIELSDQYIDLREYQQ